MTYWRAVVRRAVRGTGLAAAAAAVAGAPASAQFRALPAPPPGAAPAAQADPNENRDANEGVFVPDSEMAKERLALAQRMERLKEWNNSADLYQEILTDPKYAAKVVPAEGDPEHRLYRSVEALVMQRLARWPAEGLEVYKGRYEAQASALLEGAKADDPYVLHQVLARYFVTDVGKAAGIRLMDRYLEAGEFRAAAAIGDRLLEWHPNIGADRAAVLYRTALADHMLGDQTAAKRRLDELKNRDPQAKAIVRGAETVLAESLDKELAKPAMVASGTGADSYTTFGGEATRNRVPSVAGTPGAHLYSVAMSKQVYPTGPSGSAAEAAYKEQLKSGATLGVMPVIDRGELFFQDGQRIYAVNLESGVPLPGWVQANGAEHAGSFKLPGLGNSSRARQLALTLTDRSVLAVTTAGEAAQPQYRANAASDSRLVCVDRETGRQTWLVQPAQFKQESLRSVQMTGSPLVAGTNVLVAGTVGKQAGFEESYVLCFALDTGALRWASNIASAATFNGGFPFAQASSAAAPAESHMAFANGLVYVQTNRGAVAAVDVYNGAITWLNTYSRGGAVANGGFGAMAQFQQGQAPPSQPKPWTLNPVIVSQGLVFTLPSEGKNLLVYDAATGVKFKQIDLDELGQRLKSDDIQPPGFDTLVGVAGDALVLSGNKSVVALNWRTYDATHYDDEKMLVWAEGYGTEVRGRPFLTQSQLYLPLQDRMFMVNLKNGFAEKDYPQYPRTWGDDEGPGNIVVTSDHTVIAGAEHVDVYTDLTAAKAKLDREVADAPTDPRPRLRYAEVTYAAGDYATSLAKLDEAIARAGGADMQPGPVRDRVFNDALAFAQKLKADESPEGRRRVESLFDRAGRAAYLPEQQVYYRVARAGFDQIRGDLAAAAERYQQILSEERWRAVALNDEASRAPASADTVAREQIAALIAKDPTVYKKFEDEAAAALAKAQESNDPAKLLAVAQVYPNAAVAPRSMLAAAVAYEASGQPRLARRVLLDMYFDRKDKASDRAQVIEALARTDVRTGARLIAQGASELSDPKLRQPLKLPDGTEIAAGTVFSKAAPRMTAAALAATAKAHRPTTLPALGMPLPPTPDKDGAYPKPFKRNSPVIAGVDALAVPITGFERPDRIVTWSSEPVGLSVYRAGDDKPLSVVPQVTERPTRSAWVVGGDLIVWGARQVWMIREDGHTLAWKADVGKLPTLEAMVTDDPDAAAAMAALNNNNAAAAAMMNRRLVQARIARGGVVVPMGVPQLPQAKPVVVGPEQIDQVVPAGDRLLVSTTSGRVACFETTGGQTAWQIRLSDRPVSRVLVSDDFTVIHSETEAMIRLQVLDTFSGHVRGSKAFTRSSNSYPQNVALSADGILAYTLPDRLCLKDLYTSWAQRGGIEQRLPGGSTTFLGMNGPDQLIIEGRQVLALTDTGLNERTGQKFVHIYALDGGTPVKVNVEKQQLEQQLSAGTKSPEVRMRVVGGRLFTVAPDACVSYDLARSSDQHEIYGQELPLGDLVPEAQGAGKRLEVSDAFFGSDFLVFVASPPDEAPKAPVANAAAPAQPPANAPPAPDAVTEVSKRPWVEVAAFGRYRTARGGEGARLDYPLKVEDKAGVTDDWQAFDGGICYRTADRKLHLLLGAK